MQNGEVIINSDCSSKCTCTNGQLECNRFSCPKKRKCELNFGSYECACAGKSLSGTCKAVGDPHYDTIDGSGTFDFMGKCEYTMSHTYKIPEDDMRWFQVTVKNEERHGRVAVSYVDYVKIRLNNPDTGRKDEIIMDTDLTVTVCFINYNYGMVSYSLIILNLFRSTDKMQPAPRILCTH